MRAVHGYPEIGSRIKRIMGENGDEEGRAAGGYAVDEAGGIGADGNPEGEEFAPEYEEEHLKTKPVPAVIMLAGCSATAVMAFVRHYSMMQFLQAVLLALLLFLCVGVLAKFLLDRIVIRKEIPPLVDGLVTEKQADGSMGKIIAATGGESDDVG